MSAELSVLPSSLLWGQIRTKVPLPAGMPGRFTGAVFVAEEGGTWMRVSMPHSRGSRTCLAAVR
jgi:hypothetical protein